MIYTTSGIPDQASVFELPQVGRDRRLLEWNFPSRLSPDLAQKRKAEGGFCSGRDFIIDDQAIGKKGFFLVTIIIV